MKQSQSSTDKLPRCAAAVSICYAVGSTTFNFSATQPPPAEGVRIDWFGAPARVRAAIEQWLGSTIVSALSQQTGFSPGVAARLRTVDGRRVFAKAVGPAPNPDAPSIHRREGRIVAALPTGVPVPRLLWSYDEGDEGWVVLLFEDVDGRHPAQPWQADELDRVLEALIALADALTPSPLPFRTLATASDAFGSRLCGWQRLRNKPRSYVGELDPWSVRNLEALAELESAAPSAVSGNTMLHFDVRADNLLLTPERVWFIDWPLATVGAAWVDVVFFAPSVTMQGGPHPEHIIARHPACRSADPAAITATVASIAGFFTHQALQPPPAGLPTLRAFQAAQGVVAREWTAHRTGWA